MRISQPISKVCEVPYRLSVKDKDHWSVHKWRQKVFQGVHGKTQTILLRFRDVYDNGIIKDWPLLEEYKDDVEQILSTLKETYSFSDYCAIIANLPARQVIPRHVDSANIFGYSHRLHFPIKTNPDVLFFCGGEEINMKEGTFYEISNTNCRHGVRNNSDEDRYHYIIDLHVG